MKKIMNMVTILTAALLLSGYSLAADNFNRVARSFGRDIFISDLDPTDYEFRMLKQMQEKYPAAAMSDDQLISRARSDNLARLIWPPILAEFDKTHDVKPTE